MNKILIASRASLFPAEHGGAKNVRHVAEALAASGAEVRVLVKLHPDVPERRRFAGQRREELPGRKAGVAYKGIAGESADLARALEAELAAFRPDAVVLSDDALDEGRELFEKAAACGRLLFMAQTIHSLPFGPFAMAPSAAVAKAIAGAMLITAPSRFVARYIREQLGREAVVLTPDVFGRPPFRKLGRRDNEFVTMINPCPWKGGSVLLALAVARPDLRFAAVPTWGATPQMVEKLRSLPNMTVLEETPDIDRIFERTRVLLVPSQCQEAFGLVSPEALLRGVPVVAADIGGLPESTLGAAPLIPTRPLNPDGSEPGNDPKPWSEALDEILASEQSYERRARVGRESALAFVEALRRRDVRALLSPAGDSRTASGRMALSAAMSP